MQWKDSNGNELKVGDWAIHIGEFPGFPLIETAWSTGKRIIEINEIGVAFHEDSVFGNLCSNLLKVSPKEK